MAITKRQRIYGELAYLTEATGKLSGPLSRGCARVQANSADPPVEPALIERAAVVSLYHFHKRIGVLLDSLSDHEAVDTI